MDCRDGNFRTSASSRLHLLALSRMHIVAQTTDYLLLSRPTPRSGIIPFLRPALPAPD